MLDQKVLERYVKDLLNYGKLFEERYQSCNLCFNEDFELVDYHPKSFSIKEMSLTGYVDFTSEGYVVHLLENFNRYRESSLQESPDDVLDAFFTEELKMPKLSKHIHQMDIYVYSLDGNVYQYEFGEMELIHSKGQLDPDFLAVTTIRKELNDNRLFLPLKELESWLSKDNSLVEDLSYKYDLNNSQQIDLFEVL